MRDVKPTSAAAFHQITRAGFVGKIQQLAWLKLYEDGPMTAQELMEALNRDGLTFRSAYNSKNRLSELKRMGLVIERPARLCRVTKRAAIAWMAVVGDPVKPEPPQICPTCHRPMRKAK